MQHGGMELNAKVPEVLAYAPTFQKTCCLKDARQLGRGRETMNHTHPLTGAGQWGAGRKWARVHFR